MKDKKIVRVEDIPKREIAEIALKPSKGFVQSAGGGKVSDGEFVGRYASREELAGLRKLIEERRAKQPAFIYWVCPVCAWKAKLHGDAIEPFACFKCNFMQYRDGAWMRQMSEKEAAQFEKDTKAQEARAIERLRKARFHEVNANRGKAGLPPQTYEQFLEESKRSHQRELERSREFTRGK